MNGAGRVLEELQAIRRAAVRQGTWPAHSVAAWRELAATAAERYRAGFSPSPTELRALELFPEVLDRSAAA